MEALLTNRLVRVRHFPPVVHLHHAAEVLAGHDEAALSAWVSGYAITLPEHQRMLEDLLGSLAWGETGSATLINGRYGAGKSHLLVLLHLLLATPAAWPAFLDTYPIFRRYALALQHRRPLIVSCSLDEYGPRCPLETALHREMLRAACDADLPLPADFTQSAASGSRLTRWSSLLDSCREHAFDGVVLLVDELSLFLAGKTPTQREGDAAFLQFLAGLTARVPCRLIATLQRELSDVGALRAHSWRQVEDRFRRYTLSPQEIGQALCGKLLDRRDPAAIRRIIDERLLPAATAAGLPLTGSDLHRYWPFHPDAIPLLSAVAQGHLSPHRSLVEVVQCIEDTGWLERPADCLITPLDLFELVESDLRNLGKPDHLWDAVALLDGCAAKAGDASLARRIIRLLAMGHLAEQPVTPGELSRYLFDGTSAPAIEDISVTLHDLRRRGAYLTVARETEVSRETFRLALGDEVGVLARARMQEWAQGWAPLDPRVLEAACAACREPDWPLASSMGEGARVNVEWCGSARSVLVHMPAELSQERWARAYEGLSAGQTDAVVLLSRPGATADSRPWDLLPADDPYSGVLTNWQPRMPEAAEWAIWAEYAAWSRAANDPAAPTNRQDKQLRQRCAEHADELRRIVAESLSACYREGSWRTAQGDTRLPPNEYTLTGCLSAMLAPGFAREFPNFPALAGHGVPSPAATQQILAHFIEPGVATVSTESLLGEYLARFCEPLGCVEFSGTTARVMPPKWELLQPLLDRLAAGPLKLTDCQLLLQRPPLGLTREQARILSAAAVRSGVLQGLDAFLQPLNPDEAGLARSDAVAFLAVPAAIAAQHLPAMQRLAVYWQLPPLPDAVTRCHVDREWRRWRKRWETRLPVAQSVLAEWTELFSVLPWGWRETDALRAALAQLIAEPADLPALFAARGDDADAFIQAGDRLDTAIDWWDEHRNAVQILMHQPLPAEVAGDMHAISERLAGGEESFPALSALGEQIGTAVERYVAAYRRWHEDTFGLPAIQPLKAVFDAVDFRVLKLLTRLPLPPPEEANCCLAALAQARTAYCPGEWHGLEREGVCTRCRLPLGSPTPLPEAWAVSEDNRRALETYADLLATHPWAASLHDRLAHAPLAMAECTRKLLNWRTADGANALLDVLDDAFLAWLFRDRRPIGARKVGVLQHQLRGLDLSLSEGRALVQQWLDPEGDLPDDVVLRFE